MQRFTISLDDDLASKFDALIAARGYENRSEAVRDMLRSELDRLRIADIPRGKCVAVLSYVFNHHELDLAERVTAIQHDHHDLTVSTMHVHLNHDHCLETVVLKGEARVVQQFSDSIRAERGIHHGSVNLISMEDEKPGKGASKRLKKVGHAHSHGIGGRSHTHFKPAA